MKSAASWIGVRSLIGGATICGMLFMVSLAGYVFGETHLPFITLARRIAAFSTTTGRVAGLLLIAWSLLLLYGSVISAVFGDHTPVRWHSLRQWIMFGAILGLFQMLTNVITLPSDTSFRGWLLNIAYGFSTMLCAYWVAFRLPRHMKRTG